MRHSVYIVPGEVVGIGCEHIEYTKVSVVVLNLNWNDRCTYRYFDITSLPIATLSCLGDGYVLNESTEERLSVKVST